MTESFHGFTVPYRFPVCFTSDVFAPSNRLFADVIAHREPDRRHRVIVAIDSQVAEATPQLIDEIADYCANHSGTLELAAMPFIVPGGEAAKNDLQHTLRVLEAINEVGLDRQSFIVAVGGGAVLDMVSFAAALAHRSIRIVRVPTTVLAQADSGFAVKNGINLFGKKNFIGTFVPPFAVINDSRFLATLDQRDIVSGVVEAVKVSLLRDPELFEWIGQQAETIRAADPAVLLPVIKRSAELHLAHICGNGDPFELGSARPLDFGHWAAHKLEAMTGHRLRHGEAVAIGIALDVRYSVRMGYMDDESAERVLATLESLGLRLWDDAVVERDETGESTLLKGLREFREHLGGELHITLLKGIGSSFEVTAMDECVVRQAIADLAARLPICAPAAAVVRR
jgi:3-dehydroquinate synthase